MSLVALCGGLNKVGWFELVVYEVWVIVVRV